jgi:hypothetical protein
MKRLKEFNEFPASGELASTNKIFSNLKKKVIGPLNLDLSKEEVHDCLDFIREATELGMDPAEAAKDLADMVRLPEASELLETIFYNNPVHDKINENQRERFRDDAFSRIEKLKEKTKY